MPKLPMIFALLAAAAAPAAAASADPPPAQVKIEPGTLAAANRMLAAMGYNQMMQRSCDAMVAQMGPMFRKAIEEKTSEPVDQALIDKLTGIEAQFLHATITDSPDLRRAIAMLYASRFTAAELNHLADLYRDPVMRKWTEVSPDMTAQMFPLIHDVVDAHKDELEQKIMSAVTDYYDEKKDVPKS